jgi:ribosomal protein L14E/L6E/L27E
MFSLGDKVCSTAGRDAKKCFFVVGILDEQYVLISDGKTHRVEKPKKKKIKHLVFQNSCEEVKQKLINNYALTNPFVRKAIKINANKGEE